MSLKILFVLRLFCCVLVLVSSVKSNKNEEDSGEENTNELDKINEVESELIGKINSSLPIKKPEICNRSLEEFYEVEKPDYTWVITDFHQKLNQTKFGEFSEVFPLRGYPFVALANLLPIYGFLIIDLAYNRGNQSADSLLLATLPAVAYTFKNHSDSHHHSDPVIRQVIEPFNTAFSYDRLSNGRFLIALESKPWMPKYRVSDTVSIDIHVEPPQWSQQACSHNGTLTWVIQDYRRKLEMEKDFRMSYQASPYFYTSPNGYRVLVSILLNGFMKTRGKGLAVFLAITNGPNDKTLNKSFNYTTTVTLLHPTDPTKHITKSADHRGIIRLASVRIDMGTHEEIEHLLLNDNLYYNVTVVAID